MDKLTNWALAQLDKLPPVPVPILIGLLIVLLYVFPTIRRALKSHVEPPEHIKPESIPVVQLNAGAVYTVLTNIQLTLDGLRLDIQQLRGRIDIIDRMLRRKPRGKTSTKR